MEALTAGLPVVALPFSTDQFAVAADLVDARVGVAVDPNRATADDLAAAIRLALSPATRARAAAVGRALRREPGHERAAGLLLRGTRGLRTGAHRRRSPLAMAGSRERLRQIQLEHGRAERVAGATNAS
jgi:SLT domain-containing protein